ncbi:MAG: PAS domain S-box protein [Dehalococcoidia bacterium]|nr:PAS domain S-box protein [Dehalococcoidia bacterium]
MMPDGLRTSGLDIIGDVPWGTHFCQFYRTSQDLADILAPFFKAGLESNEFCLWITAEPLGDQQARQAMAKAMPDFDRYLEKGQIEILSHSEWYVKDGYFNSERVLNDCIDKLNQALTKGYDGFRLTGNTIWLEKKDWKDFTDYEAAINNVIGKYRILALCSYCMDKCNAIEIIDVLRHHDFALIKQEGKWEFVENSKHKAIREALITREEQFRSIYEHSPVGIQLYNAAGRLKMANKACLDIFGASETELQGYDLFGNPNLPDEMQFKLRHGETVQLRVPLDFEQVRKHGLHQTSKAGIIHLDVVIVPLSKGRETQRGYLAQIQDITQHQQSEEALKESERRFRLTLQSAPVSIATQDRNLRVLWAYNQRSVNAPDVIGKLDIDVFAPEDAAHLISLKRQIMETGVEIREQRWITANGKRLFLDLYLKPIRNETGEIIGVGTASVDMTAMKLAEEALQESQQKFKFLTTNTPDHLSVQDSNLRYTLIVNPPLGLTEKDLIGKTDFDIFSKEDALNITTLKQRVLESGSPEHVTVPMVSRDGDLQYLENTYVPRHNSEGRIDGVLSYIKNVTERVNTEQDLQKLAAIVKYSQELVGLTTPDGTIVFLNEAGAEMVGIDPEKSKKVNIFEIIPAHFRKKIRHEVLSNLMRSGQWAGDLQYRNFKTGKLTDVHARTFTITDPKTGAILYLANVSHDITIRKQAEDQIQRLARFTSENPNPVLRVNSDSTILYANEASLPLLDFWKSQVGGYLPVEYGKIASDSLRSDSDTSVEADCGDQVFALTFAPIAAAGDINIYGKDITDLKRVEEALRETSDYLNNLLDSANAPIVVWDPQFHITRFNHAFERLTSRSADKAIGKKLGILFPKESMTQSLEEIRRAIAGERWEAVELPIRHSDGTIRTVLWNSANIHASDGKTVVATIAQGQDITARKELEEALININSELEERVKKRTQEVLTERQRLYSVLETLPVMICLLKPDYHFAFANRSFRQRLGESLDRCCYEFRFGRTEPCEFCRAFKVIETGNPHRWETATPDGSSVMDAYAFPFIDTDGSPLILEMIIDITEQKQAQVALLKVHEELEMRVQERTRELRESQHDLAHAQEVAHTGSWHLDIQSNQFQLSGETYRIFGIPEGTPMTFETFFSHIHPEDREYVDREWTEALEGKDYDIQHRIIVGNEVKWIHENAALDFDEEGMFTGGFGTVQDITERKRAEEEVTRLNENLLLRADELEAANRELESFAYSVSHDLRAPLRSMEGFSLAVLEDYSEKLDDTGKDYLKRIQAASQLMGQLIDDMLRLSRVSRSEMKRQPMNLSEMANSIIAGLRETEPWRRVKVLIAPEMRVRGDRQLLQVALENLIQNSWKFTGKTPRAKIEVGITEHRGRKTYFVRDNGAGFDMAYVDKLFKPFQRLHSASEFPGTGIGLATVQRIISRHRGQVWAEAEMGKGATVYFTVP